MIKHSELRRMLDLYNLPTKCDLNTQAEVAKRLEGEIYPMIEALCTIGRKIKLKDGTFGKVRKVHGFSVQLERARTDICTWFLIDELLS